MKQLKLELSSFSLSGARTVWWSALDPRSLCRETGSPRPGSPVTWCSGSKPRRLDIFHWGFTCLVWCRLRPDLRPEVVEKEEIHPQRPPSQLLTPSFACFWSLSGDGWCKLHTTTSIFISERVGSVGAIHPTRSLNLFGLRSQHLIMKFQTCTKV